MGPPLLYIGSTTMISTAVGSTIMEINYYGLHYYGIHDYGLHYCGSTVMELQYYGLHYNALHYYELHYYGLHYDGLLYYVAPLLWSSTIIMGSTTMGPWQLITIGQDFLFSCILLFHGKIGAKRHVPGH